MPHVCFISMSKLVFLNISTCFADVVEISFVNGNVVNDRYVNEKEKSLQRVFIFRGTVRSSREK